MSIAQETAINLTHEISTVYYQVEDDINAFFNARDADDAGYDLYALKDTWVWPFQTKTMLTNAHIHVPTGHLGRVTSRGGTAKRGWLTHSGTVDSGYTGNIGVTQTNLSFLPRKVKRGERIAQLIFMRFSAAKFTKLNSLLEYFEYVEGVSDSDRGSKAYNSSGTM